MQTTFIVHRALANTLKIDGYQVHRRKDDHPSVQRWDEDEVNIQHTKQIKRSNRALGYWYSPSPEKPKDLTKVANGL